MIERKPAIFLQKIFDLRKKKKITLAQLGKVMGVKANNASAIENGDVPLKAEHLPAIAKLLGVHPSEFFLNYKDDQELGSLSVEEKDLVFYLREMDLKKPEWVALLALLKVLVKKKSS